MRSTAVTKWCELFLNERKMHARKCGSCSREDQEYVLFEYQELPFWTCGHGLHGAIHSARRRCDNPTNM